MPSNTLSGCGACGTAPGSGTTDDHDRATGTDGSGTVTGLRSALVRPTVTGPQRDRMCNRITSHARQYDYRLVRAAPRHPANASRHAKNSASREAFLVGDVCVTWWRKTPSDAQTKLCRTSDDGRNGGKTLHVTAGEIIRRSPLPDSSGRKSRGPLWGSDFVLDDAR